MYFFVCSTKADNTQRRPSTTARPCLKILLNLDDLLTVTPTGNLLQEDKKQVLSYNLILEFAS